MKHQLIVIIIILILGSISCQSGNVNAEEKDLAERIVEKICNDLSEKNSNVEEYLLMAKDLLINDNLFSKEYNAEIEANKASVRIEEKFDAYFKFILRRDCKEYRSNYDELDKNYEDRLLVREAYLNNRNLIFDLFDNEETSKLIQYFGVKDEEKLKKHLEQIKIGFNQAKARTYLHTTKLNRDEIVFYNNFSDYVSGDEKFRVVFVFDVTGENITKYAFNYGQIEIIEE